MLQHAEGRHVIAHGKQAYRAWSKRITARRGQARYNASLCNTHKRHYRIAYMKGIPCIEHTEGRHVIAHMKGRHVTMQVFAIHTRGITAEASV